MSSAAPHYYTLGENHALFLVHMKEKLAFHQVVYVVVKQYNNLSLSPTHSMVSLESCDCRTSLD